MTVGPLRRTATLVLLALSLSCGGGTFFIGIDHGVTFVSTSGTVTSVSVTITDGNTQITVVTLSNNGSSQTLNFCGNVANQFSVNTSVNVSYTQMTTCAGVVQVTVVH